uniref:Lsd-1_0 protein n=1 Tax=Fopius arisanus TaxID=64838 RepID=A0A0C9R9N6_9HYME
MLMMQRSNSLMNWSLDTAEQSLAIATASAKPAMLVLNGPITTLDHLLCRGMDIVEQRVPAVHFPPQLLYWNTREYVNNKFVRPVLKRAGSVKQIGSQAADAAADRLDGALTVADKYVDQYLPEDPTDKSQEDANPVGATSKTTRTIIHGARFSRKLQRRLTRRTLAEARALKDQSTECIHVLLYVIELIATDPKMALQKSKELWAALSLPEPENQARPATLEQLLVLLTRESARRIVHLVNGTMNLAAKAPGRIGVTLMTVSHQLLSIAEVTLKMTPVIGKSEKTDAQISILRSAIDHIRVTTHLLLERTAIFLAGRPNPKKMATNQVHDNHNNHLTHVTNRSSNGID